MSLTRPSRRLKSRIIAKTYYVPSEDVIPALRHSNGRRGSERTAQLSLAILVCSVLTMCGGPKRQTTSKANPPPPPTAGQGISADSQAKSLEIQRALASLGDQCYPGEQFGPLPTQGMTQGSLGASSPTSKDLRVGSLAASRPQESGSSSGPRIVPASLLLQAEAGKKNRAISDLQQLSKLGDIQMARYRAEKAELVLIGPPALPGQELNYDDWLAAFRAISGPEAPGVTIDPGPTPTAMQVRYFGAVENTHLGSTLFEADRTLKMLSTGFDNNNCQRWMGRPQQISTELDLLSTEVGADNGSFQPGWHRFWFEPSDDEIEVSPDGKTVNKFPTHRLVVKDESIPPGRPSRPSASQFAQSVSNNFITLTGTIPAFAELQRQAVMVALAKWLVDKHIPVDKSWIQTVAATSGSPTTTPGVTVVRSTLQDETYLRLGIHGGVDFQKGNKYVQSTALLGPFQAALKQQPPQATSWEFVYEGKHYQAVRLRYQNPYVVQNGRIVWVSVVSKSWWQPTPFRWVLPTTSLTIHNNSGVPIGMDLNGPVTKHLTVAAGGSPTRVRLIPGSYKVATNSTCGRTNKSLDIDLDKESSLTYTCEHSSPPLATGTLEVDNATQGNITIQTSGPGGGSFTAPPGVSSFRLQAGYYTITAISSCGRRTESTNLAAGGTYRTRYWCEQTERQQSGGSATLVIYNNTGAAMTIQLSGASQGTYTSAPGTSSIPLAAGFNTITASCRCGSRSNQVNVSAGSKYTETYSCVAQ